MHENWKERSNSPNSTIRWKEVEDTGAKCKEKAKIILQREVFFCPLYLSMPISCPIVRLFLRFYRFLEISFIAKASFVSLGIFRGFMDTFALGGDLHIFHGSCLLLTTLQYVLSHLLPCFTPTIFCFYSASLATTQMFWQYSAFYMWHFLLMAIRSHIYLLGSTCTLVCTFSSDTFLTIALHFLASSISMDGYSTIAVLEPLRHLCGKLMHLEFKGRCWRQYNLQWPRYSIHMYILFVLSLASRLPQHLQLASVLVWTVWRSPLIQHALLLLH